jgi:hypothetical protein
VASETARLLVPALRWDPKHGFSYLEGLIDDALELGVGGFLVEGGPQEAVAEMLGRLHADSRHPLLIAVNAERGAGAAIAGLTQLPPVAALTSVAVVDREGAPSLDPEPLRRAARLTARELRNIGANWALAPVCDAEVSTRAASDDPAIVAAVVGEWVDACQAESVLATAMSYDGKPGKPIAAAIDAGVGCVMARSASAIEGTLRNTMEFDGIVTTRPFDHDASISPQNEAAIALECVHAGCDIVLAPGDLNGVADALARAASSRTLGESRIRAARARIDARAGWARPSEARQLSLDDVMWSRQVADGGVRYLRGARPRIGASVEIVQVADAGERLDAFRDVLRAMHIEVQERASAGAHGRDPVLVLYVPAGADPTKEETARLAAEARNAADAGRDVMIVTFAHPRAAAPSATAQVPAICAWEPTVPMQQAAARALFSRAR